MTTTEDRQWELLLDQLEADSDVLESTDTDDDVPVEMLRMGELMAQAVSRRAADAETPSVEEEWQKLKKTIEAMKPMEQDDTASVVASPMRNKRWEIFAVAAAIVLAIVGGALLLFRPVEAPTDKVIAYHPPKAVANKPTITTSTGRTIVLPTNQSNVTIDNHNTTAQKRLLSALGLDTDTPIEENVTLTMPSGNSSDMVLADGTHVWLYAGSTITYPVNFYGKNRVVYLQGQAHFEVKHDASRPFIIVTDKLNATVLGTELNVSCYNGEEAHVALLNGVVEVKAKTDGKTVRLHPGQGYTLLYNGEPAVSDENMDPYTYWKQGYLYFDDAPLSDIAAQFSRWYKVRVIFDEPRMRSQRYRFFCPRTEPITRAIELLNHFSNVHASLKEDGLHIK